MAFLRKSAAAAGPQLQLVDRGARGLRLVDAGAKAPLRGLEIPAGDVGTVQLSPTGGLGARPNYDGALYPDAGFETFARLGMGRNELVGACIQEKASSLPQATLRVYPDPQGQGEALEDHPLRQLLAEPNPVMGEVEFFELQMVYKDLAGVCFTLIERGRDGVTPARLWPLRPDQVRVWPSSRDPAVWTWLYVPNLDRPEVVVPISQADMIRVRYPNPLDPYFGWPPLRPAARAIALDNATTEHVDTLLRNAAVPGIVIESQQIVDEHIAEDLGRAWRLKFGGPRKGEPAFLQTGMKVVPVGLNLRDLEFPDLRSTAESRICMALGVPPILIGARVGLDRSTFANYGEARVSFWEETMMPDQGRFLANFRPRLVPGFSGVGRRRVHLRWDNSGVLALRESEAARWERATNALRSGGVTINDFRRAVGLPPVDGGDVFLTPAGVVPTPLGASAPPPPAPAADDQGRRLQAASYAERVLAEAKAAGPQRHHGIAILEPAAAERAHRNGQGADHA